MVFFNWKIPAWEISNLLLFDKGIKIIDLEKSNQEFQIIVRGNKLHITGQENLIGKIKPAT